MIDPTLTAGLLALARRGIPPDVQELLTIGNPAMGVAPGALAAAIDAALDAAEAAERAANTCDVPGCGEHVSCGWPSPAGYRRTCSAHYRPSQQ